MDHWLGYAPNLDDTRGVYRQIKTILREELLTPVGSFQGHGEPMVFDLDGNVAEWATTEEGGKVMGPAADLPKDKSLRDHFDSQLVGFRVIRDET